MPNPRRENPAMTPWQDCPVPPLQRERHFGGRAVLSFGARPRSVSALLQRAAAQHSGRDALVCGSVRWTHAELAARTQRLANGLAAQGLGAGDRVAMWIGNRPEFLLVLLAVQHLGAIAVPVGTREQGAGLAYMLQQCGAVALVFDAELAERLPLAADTPALRLRIALDAPGAPATAPRPPDALRLQAVIDAAQGHADVPLAERREEDPAVILYTSGTTGHPKGAMLTHFNIVHSALHYEACMGLTAQDRSVLAVPASHVTGLIAILIAMLHVGGCTLVMPAFKADDFIALAERERMTHTLMVPAMYKLCLMSRAMAGADLGAWRVGGYGGAPMAVATIDELARRLPGLCLMNAYGATETTSPTTMIPPGRTRDHADSVGVALPAAELKVVDDDGRELPCGETGELWIAGPMVVPGYWDNPPATASAFTDGYWHSGDLGSIDADGYVRLFDRKKDMLNRGGYKVYSVEVENVLMAWPGVIEAAVIGRPCPVLGERVHAFVHAPGVASDDAALLAHCAAHLADYKVPETLTWHPDPLPRNPNGKLLKRRLREQLG